MNSKAKGNRSEYKTMRYLEKRGYRCTRSAASLGEWDVVAVGVDDVLLVQVKSNRWPGHNEMRILTDFKVPKGVIKLVHRWDDKEKEPKIRRCYYTDVWALIAKLNLTASENRE